MKHDIPAIVKELKTSIATAFYDGATPAEALAEGLTDNTSLVFLKAWCVKQDPALILAKLKNNTTLTTLQIGTAILLLTAEGVDRNGFDKVACEAVADLMRTNKTIVELVLGTLNMHYL